ncbi:DUF2306 domain-containing protein [Kitasatospora sp. NPDC091335]|uniref:DUF2306 domain-containing protein n=1 Tax=Kitasatospora sp. NPDC091335 TaxID=3364085 RepID=UPI00380AD2D6
MRITRAGWAIMTMLSTLIVVISAKYFRLDPEAFFEEQRDTYLTHQVPLAIHISGAITALAVGPWQFSERLRAREPRRHRRIGVVYLLGCLTGAVGALLLAPVAYGGAVAGLGFACLAVAWLITGAMGLRTVLAGRIADHRRWMIRSFALTFAAVTLRLMVLAATTAGLGLRPAYTAVAWLCWVPNLLLACWFTRTRARIRRAGPADPA